MTLIAKAFYHKRTEIRSNPLTENPPKKRDIFASQIKITLKSLNEAFQISANTFRNTQIKQNTKSVLEKVGLDSISFFFSV